MKKVSFYTLGCKLNQAETAILAEGFQKRGYQIVNFDQQADVCLINTCTVTQKTDYRCRQMVRRAISTSPEAFIIIVGCYAQLAPNKLERIEGVDLILGTDQKFYVFDYLENLAKRPVPRIITCGNHQPGEFQNPMAGDFINLNHTRAFLKVQDGCDAFCSYCVVPYARGRSRSGKIKFLLKHAEQLVQRGYKEIVVTGTHIGCYGKDLNPPRRLLDLLKAMESIPGLERIRLSSIEPLEVEDELIDWVANSEVVCPHFHIPLQSGDDQILKLMNRNYRVTDYVYTIERLLKKIPHTGLGTDVIVGFPTETEEQFCHTYDLVKEIPFSYIHVFTYSVRKGTVAAKLSPPVDPKIQKIRSSQLRDLGKEKKRTFYQRFIGKQLKVLFEENSNNGGLSGFSENYIRVNSPQNGYCVNQIYPVEIQAVDEDVAAGRVVEK